MIFSKNNTESEQETNYLLATNENRQALRAGMNSKYAAKRLTPEEWEKLQAENEQLWIKIQQKQTSNLKTACLFFRINYLILVNG